MKPYVKIALQQGIPGWHFVYVLRARMLDAVIVQKINTQQSTSMKQRIRS
jgi:predicted GTPase